MLNQCDSCGSAIEDVKHKHCPSCGTKIDRVQKEIDRKNENDKLCQNCGSPIVFNIEQQRFDCEFCHSTFQTKAENVIDSIEYEADNLIPFKMSESLAKKNFLEWLVQGKNIQLDILGKMKNIRLEQLYIPYLRAYIEYEGSWSAGIGYERQEPYITNETKKDSKGKKYTETVTKYKTVVDWSHGQNVFSSDLAKKIFD